METEVKNENLKNPLELNCFDVQQLRSYVRGTGKIVPRRRTHLSAKEQRHITHIIKQARFLLLMK